MNKDRCDGNRRSAAAASRSLGPSDAHELPTSQPNAARPRSERLESLLRNAQPFLINFCQQKQLAPRSASSLSFQEGGKDAAAVQESGGQSRAQNSS